MSTEENEYYNVTDVIDLEDYNDVRVYNTLRPCSCQYNPKPPWFRIENTNVSLKAS